MLTPSSSSLQAPRSRFSKALPPPPLETKNSRTMTPVIVPSSMSSPASRTKDLPALPPVSTKKAEPSPQQKSPASLQLPSLPLFRPLAPIGLPSTPKAPPTMAIPRRPIGKPTVTPAEPSPTGSLSSLLSAYSRSSGESLIRSSDGGTSTKDESEPTLSPTREEMGGSLGDVSSPMLSAILRAGDNHLGHLEPRTFERPTPTRTKADEPKPQNPPQAEQKPDAVSKGAREQVVTSPAFTTTSPIRRKEPPKPKPAEVTTLKLNTNSTPAAESRSTNLSNLSETPTSATQNSPARPLQPPFTHGLPGRDIRPAAAKSRNSPVPREQTQPQQPQPAKSPSPAPLQSPVNPPSDEQHQSPVAAMGSKVSQLKEKFQQGDVEATPPQPQPQPQFPPRTVSRANRTPLKQAPIPSPARPPTPEYTKLEVEVPVVDQIVSPVSPTASPDLSQYERGSEMEVSAVPPVQAPQTTTASSHRGGQAGGRAQVAEKDLQSIRSLPDMKSPSVARTSSQKPPPVLANQYATAGGATDADARGEIQDAAVARDPVQEQNFKFPPRTTSFRTAPSRQQVLHTAVSMQDMRPASRSQGSYQAYQPGMHVDGPAQFGKREDPTTYREMVHDDDLRPVDPRAAYFPLKNEQGEPVNATPPPTTVFKAAKLTTAHYECFARHSQMVLSRNKAYSLCCQACNVEDREMRWQCSWCRLRICGRCVRVLQRLDKDVSRLLDYVEKNPPGSGLSSRPSTSSGGLEKVEEAPEGEQTMETRTIESIPITML